MSRNERQRVRVLFWVIESSIPPKVAVVDFTNAEAGRAKIRPPVVSLPPEQEDEDEPSLWKVAENGRIGFLLFVFALEIIFADAGRRRW